MGSNDQERIHIHDRKVWRKWLEKNHTRKSGVRLVFYKKKTSKTSLHVSAKRKETKQKRIAKAVELLTEKKSMSDYFYGRGKEAE